MHRESRKWLWIFNEKSQLYTARKFWPRLENDSKEIEKGETTIYILLADLWEGEGERENL